MKIYINLGAFVLRPSISRLLLYFFFLSVFLFPSFLIGAAWAMEESAGVQCAELFDGSARRIPPARGLEPAPQVIALFYLPRDKCGYVDWALALREGYLAPRDSIELRGEAVKPKSSPGDIVLQVNSTTINDVLFPHETHNEVLDCKSCHPKIFKKEAGLTNISMARIFEGEYCGRCHGKVSFPLSNCNRCHSGISEVVRND